MPPKVGGSGGKRKGAGRTSGEFSQLEEEEKQEYFRGKMADNRDQPSPPRKREDRYPVTRHQYQSSPSKYKSSPSAKRCPGRPPVSPSGSKTPSTRKKEQRILILAARSRKKLSLIRSKAALRRWEAGEQSEDDGDIDDATRQLFLEDDIEMEEDETITENVFETEKSSRTKERPHGQILDATYFRKIKELTDYFTSFTNFQQVDLLVELLSNLYKDPPTFNKQKILIFMSNSSIKSHGTNRLSSWSTYKLKSRAQKLLDILSSSAEPEILLEDLASKSLLKNVSTSALLQAIGLQVDPLLISRELAAHELSIKILETLVTKRSGKNKYLAVKHAVELARTLNLSVDNHGDIALLHKVRHEKTRKHGSTVYGNFSELKIGNLCFSSNLEMSICAEIF